MNTADSSNNSLPNQHPVIVSIPSLPTCYNGNEERKKLYKQRCTLIGDLGKAHVSIPALIYTSNKNIVCRTVTLASANDTDDTTTTSLQQVQRPPPILSNINTTLSTFIYRGHTCAVTAISISKSGAYIASGDEKGCYKVWAYDHIDHLCKYSMNHFFTGPIHDIDWDYESKRIVICGERSLSDTMSGVNTKVVQWDTGVSIVHTTNTGMYIHLPKGRATSCTMKPSRPYRIVTAGREDGKIVTHSGPPFTKLAVSKDNTSTTTPMENGHKVGSTVHAVRYQPNHGNYVVSVGSDKAICLYHGTTLELYHKIEQLHTATIYDVAWSSSSSLQLLTASGDGTCKLLIIEESDSKPQLKVLYTWDVAQYQLNMDQSRNIEQQMEDQLVITKSSSTSSTMYPVGSVIMGCTFIQNGTIPVCVGYNGQIIQLIVPTVPQSSSSSILKCHLLCTGHCVPIAASCIYRHPKTNVIHMYTGDTDGVLCQWNVVTDVANNTNIQPRKRIVPMNHIDLLYITHHGAISGCTTLCTTNNESILISVGWDDHLDVSTSERALYSLSIGYQPIMISSGGTYIACIVTVKGLVLVSSSTTVASSSSTTSSGKDPSITMSSLISLPYEAQTAIIGANDTTLYVGGKDCTIYVYTINENTLEITLQHTIKDGHYKPIHCFAISHDGTKLVSCDDRDVCVWDISSSTIPTPIVGRGKWCFHTQRITSVQWSYDDKYIISGGADDSIYIWCLEKKMTRIHYNYTHRGGIISLHTIISNNKNNQKYQFVSCGVDAVVNLWDVTIDIEKKFGLK